MIRSILVCTDGSPRSDVAADYAIDLAKRLKARLLGLHVLDLRLFEGPLLADLSGAIGAQPYSDQIGRFRDFLTRRGEAVMTAFVSRCTTAGLQTESLIRTGHPPRVILQEEAHAELIVLGQKGEHADVIGEMMGSTVERVMRNSVKPCLVTPTEYQPFSRILAAFDGSTHAGQALREAAELAIAMDIELVVLTVGENSHAGQTEEISQDAKDLVKPHGAKASFVTVHGRTAAAILETARSHKCGLIALGAYGHSRIREMVLGSTTTQVVSRAHVPVLIVR